MQKSPLQQSNIWIMGKRLFSLAMPMAGTQFINVASSFLCMGMLAQLGHEVLAASALIFSAQLSISVSGISILFSLSVLIGHAFGARQYNVVGNLVQQAWILGLLISIPIMILFWNIDRIMIFFGESHQLAAIVRTYFHAFIWGVIPMFLSTCNQQFGYSIHKKGLIIISSCLSVLVLLGTAYAFIFGKFGFPTLGVAGLGYAFAAQNSFFFLLTTLLFCTKDFSQYTLFQYHAYQHWNQLKKILQVGWPICIQMAGEMMSLLVSAVMVGWIGTTELAAFQIVNQYYFLVVIPIFSLSQASGILVGQACGAQQFHEIKKFSQVSILIAITAGLIVAGAFLLFPKLLASFYIDVDNSHNILTLKLTILIFSIIAFSQLFDSLRNMFIGILRGLLDTRFPMYMSLLTIWIIGMPLSYLLAFYLNLGVVGFVFGGAIGMFIGALLMAYRWHWVSKRY